MACLLTTGRTVDCKDSVSGIKTIFIAKSWANNATTNSTFAVNGTDELQIDTMGFANWSSAVGSAVTLYRYELRPNLSSMTVNVNSDPATGTTFFEQTLALTLQKQTAADSNQMRLIAYNRPQIFVLDTNNNVYLLGMDNGCDMTSGTIVTGAAKGDMPGYTFGFVAKEKEAQIWLPAAGSEGTAKFPFDGLTDEDKLTINVGS